MNNDWRLSGQEAYLTGKALYFLPFARQSDTWEHEHCEFCWARFSDDEADLHAGYCTEPSNGPLARWICPDCYRDFKERFRWEDKT